MQLNDILMGVIKDLPSTAILLLFVILVNKQFTHAIESIQRYLNDLTELLRICISSNVTNKDNDEIRRLLEHAYTMNQSKNAPQRRR